MDLTLIRTEKRPDGIFGILTDPNGVQQAVTLEHSFRFVVDGQDTYKAMLPSGTYQLKRYFSPRLKEEVFMLQNFIGVDGQPHDYFEIHVGNYNSDSHLCACVGQEVISVKGEKMITNSRNTFNKIMRLQGDATEITFTVVDNV